MTEPPPPGPPEPAAPDRDHGSTDRGAGLCAVAGGLMLFYAVPALVYGMRAKPMATQMIVFAFVLAGLGAALLAHASALDQG
jgi:hypothetical protein